MPNRGPYRDDDRDRMRDRDDEYRAYAGRELGGYRSARGQDRDDRGRFTGRDDRGDREYRGTPARGFDRDREWSSQSRPYDRDQVCPNCGHEMTGYSRGSDDRGGRDDRYAMRDDRYRRDDASEYARGNRPRGLPDEGWGAWGSDRERGYATRSGRTGDHWNRDEYGGSADDERWRYSR